MGLSIAQALVDVLRGRVKVQTHCYEAVVSLTKLVNNRYLKRFARTLMLLFDYHKSSNFRCQLSIMPPKRTLYLTFSNLLMVRSL